MRARRRPHTDVTQLPAESRLGPLPRAMTARFCPTLYGFGPSTWSKRRRAHSSWLSRVSVRPGRGFCTCRRSLGRLAKRCSASTVVCVVPPTLTDSRRTPRAAADPAIASAHIHLLAVRASRQRARYFSQRHQGLCAYVDHTVQLRARSSRS